MQRFTELKVWQRSHALVLEVYQLSATFPPEERFGLVSQIRRAAVSVPSNIAEGTKRQSNLDFARFLNIAEASLAEVEYLLMLSRDLGYLVVENATSLLSEVDEIARMLNALRSKVEAQSSDAVSVLTPPEPMSLFPRQSPPLEFGPLHW